MSAPNPCRCRGAGYPHICTPTHPLAWQSALQAPRMQDPLLLWEIPREALGSSGVLWGASEGQVGGCRGCAKNRWLVTGGWVPPVLLLVRGEIRVPEPCCQPGLACSEIIS